MGTEIKKEKKSELLMKVLSDNYGLSGKTFEIRPELRDDIESALCAESLPQFLNITSNPLIIKAKESRIETITNPPIKYLILIDKITKYLNAYNDSMLDENKHLIKHFDENELGNIIGIAIGDYCYKRDIELDVADFVDNIRNGLHHGIDLTTVDGMELNDNKLIIRDND